MPVSTSKLLLRNSYTFWAYSFHACQPRAAWVILGILVLLSCVAVANAQVLYGTLVGNVTDPSGGVVVGATVRIVNTGTGQTEEVTTNAAGLYTFSNVPAGTYNLTVSAPGFAAFTEEGILLNVNTVQRHDVALKVGTVGETVLVEGMAVALQTDKADVSSELGSQVVSDLPLTRYRNFQSAINLVPGASPARFQNANTDSPQRSLATNINGTSRRNNSTRIDGTLTMQLQLAHASYIPTAESIEVVNVTTDAADAEQGLAGGSDILVQTKSGTNQFHGTAYEFNTSNFLAARDFFNRNPHAPKNIINDLGGTFGGPIKKDKLFFFSSYEMIRERTAFGLLFTLPTDDARAGNFSAYPTTIYDPATGTNGAGRTPLPNNNIPANRLNPIALKFQGWIPEPNQPGLTNNYYNSGTDNTNRYQFDNKVNYNLNASHTMFLKWGYFDARISGVGGLGKAQGQCLCSGGATGSGAGLTKVNTSTFGQTKIFRPNLIYDMTIGWTREGQTVAQTDRGTNVALDVLGIPGTNGGQINQSGDIRIDFASQYSPMGNVDNWMPAERHEMVYDMTHNFSYLKNKHNIRFGFEGIHNRLNHFQPGPATQGNAFFTDGATRSSDAPTPKSVQANVWASYLFGYVNEWQKGLQWEEAYAIDWQYGLYIRDRWQVSPKLTISYGIRWEYYPMMHRAGAHHTGVENWDPASNLVSLGGNGGLPSGLGIGVSKKLFTPRLGIAYRLSEKFVIRTGYGINIDPTPFLGWNRAQWPDAITGDFVGPNTFVPFDTLQQGIPPFGGPPAGTPTVTMDPKASVTYFPGDLVRRSYIQSWNFTVEGRLSPTMVASIGYVGTGQAHLRTSVQKNYARPGTGTAGEVFNKLFGRTASTSFSDGNTSSNFHSLQAGLNRRVSGGLAIKAGYTWSHNLGMFTESGGSINFALPEMWRRNYTNTTNDITHNFEAGFVYDLPFGKGKNMLNTGLASKIAGGWQVNGILAMYTGRPFDITSSSTACNCPQSFSTFTGDLVGPVKKIGSPSEWFDPSAFAQVTRRTGTDADYGNLNQRVLRAPGMINLDTSLFREFRVNERVRLQFRAESFNIANKAHFNPPDGNASSPTFMVINASLGDGRFSFDATNRSFRWAAKVIF